jgi:hypothetical protein
VRNIQELTVALGLGECHEPWCAQVLEDLRFVVKDLDELSYFRRVGTCVISMPYTWYICVITCALILEGEVTGMALISSTALAQSILGIKLSKERRTIFLDGPRVVVLGFFTRGVPGMSLLIEQRWRDEEPVCQRL